MELLAPRIMGLFGQRLLLESFGAPVGTEVLVVEAAGVGAATVRLLVSAIASITSQPATPSVVAPS